jgi:hypothetical protein
MSVARKCLEFSGLFEAELLIELMLRYWKHPLADDADFRNEVLESAAQVLQSCVGGQSVIEGIPAEQTNLVAAVWYVEWNNVTNGAKDPDGQRSDWLQNVRRSVPSCFCPQARLP